MVSIVRAFVVVLVETRGLKIHHHETSVSFSIINLGFELGRP